MKIVPPSIRETAFSCPYCGALTTQYWHQTYARRCPTDSLLPLIVTQEDRERIASDQQIANRKELLKFADRSLSGFIFLEETADRNYTYPINNLHLSQCFNCEKYAVWFHDRLLLPRERLDIQPNPDLPDDVTVDFNEAREIADASPRGAAALLRLCIQKICKHLGVAGKTIDECIGSMVEKGLNPLVQKSLDIVRVIGNEAVHPGELNLKDDRDTVMRLFELVNAIAEQMISHPRIVQTMYEKLPEPKRIAIEKRDSKS